MQRGGRVGRWMVRVVFLVVVVSVVAPRVLPATTPEADRHNGVTFSAMYAESLGLDPVTSLTAVVDDLGVRRVRLPVYWNRVATSSTFEDWAETDALMQVLDGEDLHVTMVVGRRVPRWPECHEPAWVLTLSHEAQVQAEREFVQKTVERYRGRVDRWQVQNEPFLKSFGECDRVTTAQELQNLVALVTSLDPQVPLSVTASGEWSSWRKEAASADEVGVSVYRTIYTPLLGRVTYPVPPWWYRAKAWAIGERPFVSELQAEPWIRESAGEVSWAEQSRLFTPEDLRSRTEYARRIGFSETYYWGVEWWDALRQAGYNELWNEAKGLSWL